MRLKMKDAEEENKKLSGRIKYSLLLTFRHTHAHTHRISPKRYIAQKQLADYGNNELCIQPTVHKIVLSPSLWVNPSVLLSIQKRMHSVRICAGLLGQFYGNAREKTIISGYEVYGCYL